MLNFRVSEMEIKKSHILLFVLSLALYSACVKKKTYSTEPEIAFKSFYPFPGDSADFTITFSDGDGDIGKVQEDSTKNLFMTYYYKDTITQKFVGLYNSFLNDTVRFTYTIRKPKDQYAGKPISGEISVKINEYRHDPKFKNLKYVVYIVDNANHKSNVITTPELIAP
jgi:hypothetical protein